MVYITGEDGVVKKFACLTCIKGHRSSGCRHTDRELLEIKRKGRPVSQCAECRELRKTKQVHIKCICHTKTAAEALENLSTAQPRSSQLELNVNLLSQTCSRCQRSSAFCICVRQMGLGASTPTATPQMIHSSFATGLSKHSIHEFESHSSASSDGSVTPPSAYTPKDNARLPYTSLRLAIPDALSTECSYTDESPRLPISGTNVLNMASPHSAGLNPIRPLAIPIHDPSDDIDSDTPIYKSVEHHITDKTAVLGELSHTSSEDLMNQIYSGFDNRDKAYLSSNTTTDDGHPMDDYDENTGVCETHACGCSSCHDHSSADSHAKHNVTVVMDDDGVMICGCGCGKPLAPCTDCFKPLSEEYSQSSKILRTS